MASSKDPFNFDDIYKQAGVGDLFVKKTMGEMKKAAPPPAPRPAPAQTTAPLGESEGGGGEVERASPGCTRLGARLHATDGPTTHHAKALSP